MTRSEAETQLWALAPAITSVLQKHPGCDVDEVARCLQPRGSEMHIVDTIFDVREVGVPYLVRDRSTSERVTVLIRHDEGRFALLEAPGDGQPNGAAGSFYT